ncbi:MAG: hypothetical protein CMN00_00805 [Rickettsiales bacterium]|nr:hypothetical protein [Rickettsiales bacterium]
MIGCLSLGRETFDVNFANEKIGLVEKRLNKLSYNIIFFEKLITNDEISEEALSFFKQKKCKKYLIIQSTFTDSKFIKKFTKVFKKPIFFISFKEKRTGGRLRLNSLCGVNLGLHSLIKNKIYSDFVICDKEVKYFNKKIVEFINNKDTLDKSYLKKIENSGKNFKQITYSNPKIALVGKRPDGFDTCDYEVSELKNKLHTNVSQISLKKLFKISSKIEKNEIINTKKNIGKNFKDLKNLNQIEVEKSISLFHGLEKIQKKEKFDAFAVRCWPEMFTEYGCASCAPMAMMNETKISAACEADVLGSLSCNILNQLNNKPALLVDIVDVDEKDNTTVFWHCGLAPISMAEKNTPGATVHSNRKKPLLHNFAFKSGEITIFRVSKSENKLKFILMKGKVLKRKNSFSGTSGVIRLGQNTFKKIKNLFLSGLEHHVCFTYGDVIEDIKTLGKQLKIPTYTI